MKLKIASTHKYVARCELYGLAELRLLNPRQLFTARANYCSALEVGASSKRRARYSVLHNQFVQKFQDLGCQEGTVISSIFLEFPGRCVGMPSMPPVFALFVLFKCLHDRSVISLQTPDLIRLAKNVYLGVWGLAIGCL